MEKFLQEKFGKYGDSIHGWSYKEFEEHERGMMWYLIFAAALVIMAIYCFTTKNFLFLVIIVMFTLLEVMFKFKKPDYLDFSIYTTGIRLNDFFCFWSEIKEYYIIYDVERSVKKLYFIFNKSTTMSWCIELENQNPVEIRETLNKYIKENLDRKYEHFSDQISSMLKL